MLKKIAEQSQNNIYKSTQGLHKSAVQVQGASTPASMRRLEG